MRAKRSVLGQLAKAMESEKRWQEIEARYARVVAEQERERGQQALKSVPAGTFTRAQLIVEYE